MLSQTPAKTRAEDMQNREKVANRPKHWVRAVTACNSRCLFCLDMDTPRNVFLPVEEVRAELLRGREQLGAEKVIISGGEASLHPQFIDFVSYAKEIGYERVQTVTNGYRFADPGYLEASLSAGLGEITYSIHGHTAQLHDHLTQTKGAFRRITKAIAASVRDGRPVVNVDVCINKQNVGDLDKLVELCIQLGVTEFDLLHVIPQAAAFEHRDVLFYDPIEHLPTLHKVFRLNRHPRFVVWTNRFPVPFLEGLEDLIQDPHKMLDEINGRRFQVRGYLDAGKPLDCRDPERCQHCFIEPMCNTMDEVVQRQLDEAWDVWWVGADEAPQTLPFGCTALGVEVTDAEAARALTVPGAGLYVRTTSAEPLATWEGLGVPVTLVATTPAQVAAWVTDDTASSPVRVVIELREALRDALLTQAEALGRNARRVHLHQPSYEHMTAARANDIVDLHGFTETLSAAAGELTISGLPACLAPGLRVTDPPLLLRADLFDADTGRLGIRRLARYHVEERYSAKSLRCRDCRIESRCDGAHINHLRHAGLKSLRPLREGVLASRAEEHALRRYPEPPARLAKGAPPLPAAPSLPGFAAPEGAPRDPLAVIAEEQLLKKQRRRGLVAPA
ncbi:MAG: radical SAM protein [Polyangiales bacterium]|nr:radical SAM protein [Sandaracinaceae bacterium]